MKKLPMDLRLLSYLIVMGGNFAAMAVSTARWVVTNNWLFAITTFVFAITATINVYFVVVWTIRLTQQQR